MKIGLTKENFRQFQRTCSLLLRIIKRMTVLGADHPHPLHQKLLFIARI